MSRERLDLKYTFYAADTDHARRGTRYDRTPSPLVHGMNNLNVAPRQRKASSFKKPKRADSDGFQDDEEMRPRTSSMPTRSTIRKPALHVTHAEHYGNNLDPDFETYRLRSFDLTTKGMIINRGDSLRSRSTNSVLSSGSEFGGILSAGSRTSSSLSRESLGTSPGSVTADNPVPSRVLVAGADGVGKTAITQQFMTSEYLGGFDTSLDGEPDKYVSVLLDGEESALSFIDSTGDMDLSQFNAIDAYLVVYAIDDRETFDRAVDILYFVRKAEGKAEPIILVGNKSDLVRSRAISNDEAKAVAMTYDCKYTETSTVLNHNVDELLVGTVKQIRLKINGTDKEKSRRKSKDGGSCASKSKTLLTKIFKKENLSKSCENLYVL